MDDIQGIARAIAEDFLAKLQVLEAENDRLRGHIRVLTASVGKLHADAKATAGSSSAQQ